MHPGFFIRIKIFSFRRNFVLYLAITKSRGRPGAFISSCNGNFADLLRDSEIGLS